VAQVSLNLRALQRMLIFAFIVMSPFQDFFLGATPLKVFGSSAAAFPLIALGLLDLYQLAVSRRPVISRLFCFAFLYVILVTCLGIFLFGIQSQDTGLLYKMVTSTVIATAFYYPIFGVDYGNSQLIRRAVYVAAAICLLGFVFGRSNPFGIPSGLVENWIFHHSDPTDARPRGFESESSVFGLYALCYGLLTVHFLKNNFLKVLAVFITFSVMIASGSRGAVLMLIPSVLFFTVTQIPHKRLRFVFGIAMCIAGIVGFVWLLPTMFSGDLAGSGLSATTRLTLQVAGIKCIVHYPLGVGMVGFFPALARQIPDAINFVSTRFPIPWDFSEVVTYIVTTTNESAKTLLLDESIRFGLPFLIAFFYFGFKVCAGLFRRNKMSLFFLTTGILIAFSTYTVIIAASTLAMALGIAYRESGWPSKTIN